MLKSLFLFAAMASSFALYAQSGNWDLLRCVNYAREHNISVRQADVQSRLAALQLYQTKGQRIPTLDFNANGGIQFGRSIDPTSNSYTNNHLFYQSYNLSSGVTLFNWFSTKNAIKSDDLNRLAAEKDVERAQSDVALNVAAAYLQLLLSVEQVNIAKTQIDLTKNQLDLTQKLVAAGSQPQLNVLQLASQLSTDSSTYISNLSTMNQNKLQLLALLNLPADAPFEVSVPDVDRIPLKPLSELAPDAIYQTALHQRPQQIEDSLKLEALRYGIKSARGAMLPTLSAFGQIATNYANTFKEASYGAPTIDTLGSVNINGNNYAVTYPGITTTLKPISYWRQISNINLSQSIGLTIAVPILKNRQLKANLERSRINLDNMLLQQELSNQTLQQDIYKAYNNALTGIQNYNANTSAENYASEAYDMAGKRYKIGAMNTSDLLIQQNNLYKARINRSAAHYEYIFRLKVLEFYRDNNIDL